MGNKPTHIASEDSVVAEYRNKYPQHWTKMEEKLLETVKYNILRLDARGVSPVTPKSVGKHIDASGRNALDNLLSTKTSKQTILYVVLGKQYTLQRVSAA
jgi:hypothetical protein